jgi:hypothetical protein
MMADFAPFVATPAGRLHPLFPGAIVASALGCAASAAGLPVGATVGAHLRSVRIGTLHLFSCFGRRIQQVLCRRACRRW